MMRRFLSIALGLLVWVGCGESRVLAAAYDANDSASLQAAIEAVNAGGDSSNTITLLDDITLSLTLPQIDLGISRSLTIVGASQTISGADTYRIFYVNSGLVTIQNATLADGYALGADGANSESGTNASGGGGGGGLGAGGAIFVATGASVVAQNVTFSNNLAGGGDGGNAIDGSSDGAGGAGGAGPTGLTGGAGGSGGSGFDNGGVGGNGAFGSGGGGGGSASDNPVSDGGNGGAGGFGAGGGGGGWGSLSSGDGGPGGPITPEEVNFAGGSGAKAGLGDNGYGGGGGGGSGLGGSVFVMNGGNFTLFNSSMQNGSVTAGAGGTGYNNGFSGGAVGAGVFLYGGTGLTIQADSAGNVVSDDISSDGTDAGLTVTGTGSAVLSANNTYTGPTVINGALLLVNNVAGSEGDSGTGSGDVTATNGGLLGGTGSVAGPVEAESNGGIAPGGALAPGTLTLQNTLTLATSAELRYRLGTSSDLLSVQGQLVLSTGIQLFVVPGSGFGPGQYNLISFGSLADFSGGFNGWTISGLEPFQAGNFQFDGNTLQLNVALVPEPSACALFLAGGLAALAVARSRRRG